MNMPKYRDMHAKILSPKAILLNFGIVSVKVLNRYVENINDSGKLSMSERNRYETRISQEGGK